MAARRERPPAGHTSYNSRGPRSLRSHSSFGFVCTSCAYLSPPCPVRVCPLLPAGRQGCVMLSPISCWPHSLAKAPAFFQSPLTSFASRFCLCLPSLPATGTPAAPLMLPAAPPLHSQPVPHPVLLSSHALLTPWAAADAAAPQAPHMLWSCNMPSPCNVPLHASLCVLPVFQPQTGPCFDHCNDA